MASLDREKDSLDNAESLDAHLEGVLERLTNIDSIARLKPKAQENIKKAIRKAKDLFLESEKDRKKLGKEGVHHFYDRARYGICYLRTDLDHILAELGKVNPMSKLREEQLESIKDDVREAIEIYMNDEEIQRKLEEAEIEQKRDELISSYKSAKLSGYCEMLFGPKVETEDNPFDREPLDERFNLEVGRVNDAFQAGVKSRLWAYIAPEVYVILENKKGQATLYSLGIGTHTDRFERPNAHVMEISGSYEDLKKVAESIADDPDNLRLFVGAAFNWQGCAQRADDDNLIRNRQVDLFEFLDVVHILDKEKETLESYVVKK